MEKRNDFKLKKKKRKKELPLVSLPLYLTNTTEQNLIIMTLYSSRIDLTYNGKIVQLIGENFQEYPSSVNERPERNN